MDVLLARSSSFSLLIRSLSSASSCHDDDDDDDVVVVVAVNTTHGLSLSLARTHEKLTVQRGVVAYIGLSLLFSPYYANYSTQYP